MSVMFYNYLEASTETGRKASKAMRINIVGIIYVLCFIGASPFVLIVSIYHT